MKILHQLALLLLLTIALSSCADPRKEAEAFRITTEAQQNALNQEMNRQHAETMFQMQQEQERLAYQMNAELKQRLWSIIYVVFACVSVAAIIMGGRSTIQAYQIVTIGMANAAVQAANIKSRLIYLDAATGQFPLIVEHVGKGIITMTDMNTGLVVELNTAREGDRLMIQGAMATRHTGVLANAAAKSQDPAGVSIIPAPSWTVQDEDWRIYDNQ